MWRMDYHPRIQCLWECTRVRTITTRTDGQRLSTPIRCVHSGVFTRPTHLSTLPSSDCSFRTLTLQMQENNSRRCQHFVIFSIRTRLTPSPACLYDLPPLFLSH